MKTRGRPTRIDAKLTSQFCELFHEGLSVTATCAALEVSESKFHEWMKKGEQGEKPYSEFRQRTLCARAWGKIAHLRAIFANKDWRGRAWYLERTFPLEFGRCAERDLPADLEKKKISVAVILNTGGKTLEEVTNFPIVDDLSPPKGEATSQEASNAHTGQRRPIVGAGGHVIGWTDEDAADDDADLP
jgi:hypothetical protein